MPQGGTSKETGRGDEWEKNLLLEIGWKKKRASRRRDWGAEVTPKGTWSLDLTIRRSQELFVLFCFYVLTGSIWNFWGQGSNPSSCLDPHRSLGNAGSLTRCTVVGTPKRLIFFFFLNPESFCKTRICHILATIQEHLAVCGIESPLEVI